VVDSLWYASGSSFSLGPDVTVAGDYTPAPGDFDADAKDDIAWSSDTGSTTLWLGT
jgi:hypothetical protein